MKSFVRGSSLKKREFMLKNTRFISVPLDLGANTIGSKNGPEALLKHFQKIDFYKQKNLNQLFTLISVPERNKFSETLKFKEEITDTCKQLREVVRKALHEKELPISIGGDHSLAIGSIFGAQAYCYEKGLTLGVIWLDAHADINTPESSETGNIHGMPLATLLGMGHSSLLDLCKPAPFLDGKQVYLAGVRDVDEKEQVILDASHVYYAPMARIKEINLQVIAQEIEKNILNKYDCIHLSIDLDVMDPSLAPSVSTPVKKGMTLEEAKAILLPLKKSRKLLSLDLVEYNPLNEKDGKGLNTSTELLSYLL